MKTLKNCVKLRSQVKVYVPSTVNVNESFDSSEWIDKTLAFLSSNFGGATCTPSLGAWITNKGELVKENINMCFAFCDQSDLEKHIEGLYEFCLEMKVKLSQEAIALEVNGELYLI